MGQAIRTPGVGVFHNTPFTNDRVKILMVPSEVELPTEIAVHSDGKGSPGRPIPGYSVTLGAVVLLLVRSFRPNILPGDSVTIALLIAALFPWIPSIASSVEFPGGWKFEFRELEAKTARLQKDVDALRFLILGFVSQFEIVHLMKLAKDEPFRYERGANRDNTFVNELIRLWNFGLIAMISKQNAAMLWNIPLSGNLKDYVEITQRGRDYLKLRDGITSD